MMRLKLMRRAGKKSFVFWATILLFLTYGFVQFQQLCSRSLIATNSDSVTKESIPTKTGNTIPLVAPYRIVQIGIPRSGSTFQYELLRSIVSLKINVPGTATNYKMHAFFMTEEGWEKGSFQRSMESIRNGHDTKLNFVIKTHVMNDPNMLEAYNQAGEIAIFTSESSSFSFFNSNNDPKKNDALSANMRNRSGITLVTSLYTQDRILLEQCRECEIEKYRPIFDLTDTEMTQLKDHMRIFQIIRQCCGLQISKFEMARLNGCDVQRFQDRLDYPHCELYDSDGDTIYAPSNENNKNSINGTKFNKWAVLEKEFLQNGIPYETTNPEFIWAQPGDCAKFRKSIVTERLGFNGYPFPGCQQILPNA